jgi:uncharacterized protein with GYD domain
MAFYLYQCSYTPEAVKTLIARPHDRKVAVAKMIEALGGKLHHFFFALGSCDVVALLEAPDDETVAAGAMLVAGSGSVTGGALTKLISVEAAMNALRLAGRVSGAYTPPTG